MIPYILTGSVLILTKLDGTPLQVPSTHPNYHEVLELVTSPSTLNIYDLYTTIEELVTPILRLKRISELDGAEVFLDNYGNISCTVDGKGIPVPQDVGKSIIELYESNGNIEPLINFLRKLDLNPDKDVANQLWGFIQSCGLSLTPEGNFLAYKNVNNDFTSVADSNTENNPGTVLRMPRGSVEKNPNRTCAPGLHFAAWGYLQHYAWGRKTVLVSVSPRDVVSIPSDYNNQKGRACGYRIVREVEQPEELKHITYFDEDGTDYE